MKKKTKSAVAVTNKPTTQKGKMPKITNNKNAKPAAASIKSTKSAKPSIKTAVKPAQKQTPVSSKTYVLDTNVVFDDPKILDKLVGNVAIPLMVIEECDNHKKDQGAIGAAARYFARTLNAIMKNGDLLRGVRHEKACVRIVPWSNELAGILKRQGLPDMPDNRIATTALAIKGSILLSNDIALRLKATAQNQICETYDCSTSADSIEDIYSGFTELTVTSSELNTLHASGSVPTAYRLFPNEFVHLTSMTDPKQTALAKFRDGQFFKVSDKKGGPNFRPRNIQQIMFFDALMDPNMTLCTALGVAGTGKSITAMAAAIEQTLGAKPIYEKIILMKPVADVGAGVGFLPGDLSEKTSFSNQSFFDNLEILIPSDRKNANTWEYLVEMGKIEFSPPTFMRGRSLAKTILIIDEAQNLSRSEVKTLATRLGEGSKLVMMGDVAQIDVRGLDYSNNGLTHIIECFAEQDCASHIKLVKGERSGFAELAAKIL